MSKDESIKEYLEDLDHYDEGMGIHSTSYEKCKERLIRLAKIENSKPSEALEELERLRHSGYVRQKKNTTELTWSYFNHSLDTIKQALLKSQEQEKVLEIIFEKNVNIASLKAYDLEEYNMVYENKLTQEEFDLLKRYCDEQNN